jgi:hypothetical protein
VRLKAEFKGGDAMAGAGAALGAGAGAEGMERSSKSPSPEDEAAGLDGAGDENEEKSERPLDGLVVRFCAWYVVAFGFESKKLPPPPNMFEEDVVGGDLAVEKLSRPENGDGLGAGCAPWPNDKLLNASFMPPNCDC